MAKLPVTNTASNMPWYIKVYIEGRRTPDEPWAVRNRFNEENALAVSGKMETKRLLEKANHVAEEWRRSYPNGGQTRVINLKA